MPMPPAGWSDGSAAIVDDEHAIVEIYRRILDMLKIHVAFIAYDGQDAVEKFAASNPKPAIILMDYRLPILDGISASREIMRLDPGVKIIFLSADANIEEEAMKVGAIRFIHKPASIKEIAKAVEMAAEAKRDVYT